MIELDMRTKIEVLDLSSFDTSNVPQQVIFIGASATVGYARTQADADFLIIPEINPLAYTLW